MALFRNRPFLSAITQTALPVAAGFFAGRLGGVAPAVRTPAAATAVAQPGLTPSSVTTKAAEVEAKESFLARKVAGFPMPVVLALAAVVVYAVLKKVG